VTPSRSGWEVDTPSFATPAVTDLWAASQIGLWVFVVFLALLVLGLYRQVAELAMPLSARVSMQQGLDIGERAPSFKLADQRGNEVAFASDINGAGPSIVAFGSPDCEPCNDLADELRDLAPESLRILFVAGTSRKESKDFAATHQVQYPVLTDDDTSSTREGYKVSSTPYVYVIDRGGVVRAKGIASNRETVTALVAEGLGKRWTSQVAK
jgi:methylamine dehydrogenase accessory protein MauD